MKQLQARQFIIQRRSTVCAMQRQARVDWYYRQFKRPNLSPDI